MFCEKQPNCLESAAQAVETDRQILGLRILKIALIIRLIASRKSSLFKKNFLICRNSSKVTAHLDAPAVLFSPVLVPIEKIHVSQKSEKLLKLKAKKFALQPIEKLNNSLPKIIRFKQTDYPQVPKFIEKPHRIIVHHHFI